MSGNCKVVVLVVTGIPSEFVIVVIDSVIQDGSCCVPAIFDVPKVGSEKKKLMQWIDYNTE